MYVCYLPDVSIDVIRQVGPSSSGSRFTISPFPILAQDRHKSSPRSRPADSHLPFRLSSSLSFALARPHSFAPFLIPSDAKSFCSLEAPLRPGPDSLSPLFARALFWRRSGAVALDPAGGRRLASGHWLRRGDVAAERWALPHAARRRTGLRQARLVRCSHSRLTCLFLLALCFSRALPRSRYYALLCSRSSSRPSLSFQIVLPSSLPPSLPSSLPLSRSPSLLVLLPFLSPPPTLSPHSTFAHPAAVADQALIHL
eukprot:1011223-Pleurochrysis_carterae.AAC.1